MAGSCIHGSVHHPQSRPPWGAVYAANGSLHRAVAYHFTLMQLHCRCIMLYTTYLATSKYSLALSNIDHCLMVLCRYSWVLQNFTMIVEWSYNMLMLPMVPQISISPCWCYNFRACTDHSACHDLESIAKGRSWKLSSLKPANDTVHHDHSPSTGVHQKLSTITTTAFQPAHWPFRKLPLTTMNHLLTIISHSCTHHQPWFTVSSHHGPCLTTDYLPAWFLGCHPPTGRCQGSHGRCAQWSDALLA